MKNYITLIVMFIIGLFVGNRIFNHVNAWIGVGVILFTIFFVTYKLIKALKNEKKDCKGGETMRVKVRSV